MTPAKKFVPAWWWGFEERFKLPVDSPTVDKDDIRILAAVAVGMKWKIKCADVSSAFLQGEPLERTVLLKPPPELTEAKGKLLRLKTALYGLSDASLQWFRAVQKALINLGCIQSTGDPALYFKHKDGKIEGIIATHVDDFLYAGTNKFEMEVICRIKRTFKFGESKEEVFTYVGYEFAQSKQGIVVKQEDFIRDKLTLFDVPAER